LHLGAAEKKKQTVKVLGLAPARSRAWLKCKGVLTALTAATPTACAF
jgi:hypothetical protein